MFDEMTLQKTSKFAKFLEFIPEYIFNFADFMQLYFIEQDERKNVKKNFGRIMIPKTWIISKCFVGHFIKHQPLISEK